MFAGLNVKGTTDPEILQQLSADSKKEQEDKDKERETKHTKPQKQHPRVALPTRGRASRPTSVRSRRPLAAPQHAAHAISGTSGSKGLFEGLTVLKPVRYVYNMLTIFPNVTERAGAPSISAAATRTIARRQTRTLYEH